MFDSLNVPIVTAVAASGLVSAVVDLRTRRVPNPLTMGIAATGLAFAAGAAVVAGLWGWASPGWGGGYANVNVNRYNNINANRSQINGCHLNRKTICSSGLLPSIAGGTCSRGTGGACRPGPFGPGAFAGGFGDAVLAAGGASTAAAGSGVF